MSLWLRLTNVFRGDGLNRDIDEEVQSHIVEAVEHGRDPAEVRRSFGAPPSATAKRAATYGARTAAYRKRRPHSGRTSIRGTVARLLDPPLRTGSEGGWAHAPDG